MEAGTVVCVPTSYHSFQVPRSRTVFRSISEAVQADVYL